MSRIAFRPRSCLASISQRQELFTQLTHSRSPHPPDLRHPPCHVPQPVRLCTGVGVGSPLQKCGGGIRQLPWRGTEARCLNNPTEQILGVPVGPAIARGEMQRVRDAVRTSGGIKCHANDSVSLRRTNRSWKSLRAVPTWSLLSNWTKEMAHRTTNDGNRAKSLWRG